MIEFTSSGNIEVTRNGQVLSRHRQEREAIESCAEHGNGDYVILYPPVRVAVRDGQLVGIINGTVNA